MTSFDDRKKSFEDKFKHDQELTFKITARRNKLLGLWAAERLGLKDDAADAYAKDVIASDFQKPGDDDIVQKVAGDLAAKNTGISVEQVRDALNRLALEARKQIVGG
jgi:hypothetical protein